MMILPGVVASTALVVLATAAGAAPAGAPSAAASAHSAPAPAPAPAGRPGIAPNSAASGKNDPSPPSQVSQDAPARSRMHECGHQWSAMKKAGTVGTLTWKEFSATCLVVSR